MTPSSRLRSVEQCKRAQKHTRIRARAIICVAKTERMLFETAKQLRDMIIRRPL